MIGQDQEDNDKEEREAEKEQSRNIKQQLKDARDQIELGRMMFEYNVEGLIVTSKLMWARFSSLMEAGFNEQQAMGILIERGIN